MEKGSEEAMPSLYLLPSPVPPMDVTVSSPVQRKQSQPYAVSHTVRSISSQFQCTAAALALGHRRS